MKREIKISPASVPFEWQDNLKNSVILKPNISGDEVTHNQLICGRDPDKIVTITLYPGRANNGNGHFVVANLSELKTGMFPETVLFDQWVHDVTYFALHNRGRDALYILYQGLRETFKYLRENDICDIAYAHDLNDIVDDTLYLIITQFLHSCLRVLMYERLYCVECGLCLHSPFSPVLFPGSVETPEQRAESENKFAELIKKQVQSRHPDIKMD